MPGHYWEQKVEGSSVHHRPEPLDVKLRADCPNSLDSILEESKRLNGDLFQLACSVPLNKHLFASEKNAQAVAQVLQLRDKTHIDKETGYFMPGETHDILATKICKVCGQSSACKN